MKEEEKDMTKQELLQRATRAILLDPTRDNVLDILNLIYQHGRADAMLDYYAAKLNPTIPDEIMDQIRKGFEVENTKESEVL